MSDGLGWPECTCNVGARRCGVHPERWRTKEQKIAFRKQWDEAVDRGQRTARVTR